MAACWRVAGFTFALVLACFACAGQWRRLKTASLTTADVRSEHQNSWIWDGSQPSSKSLAEMDHSYAFAPLVQPRPFAGLVVPGATATHRRSPMGGPSTWTGRFPGLQSIAVKKQSNAGDGNDLEVFQIPQWPDAAKSKPGEGKTLEVFPQWPGAGEAHSFRLSKDKLLDTEAALNLHSKLPKSGTDEDNAKSGDEEESFIQLKGRNIDDENAEAAEMARLEGHSDKDMGEEDDQTVESGDDSAKRIEEPISPQVKDVLPSHLSMQTFGSTSSSFGEEESPTHNPIKTPVHAHKVLGDWARDAVMKELLSEESHDSNREVFMAQTLRTIKTIQTQLEHKITDQHVLGLAVPDLVSPDSIKVVASVFLESWNRGMMNDDYGELMQGTALNEHLKHAENSPQVPIVFISHLVAAPRPQPDEIVHRHSDQISSQISSFTGSMSRTGQEKNELVHGIVAWAKEAGRLVTVTPANKEAEAYYKGLGFQRINEFTPSMVYSGNQEEHWVPSRGLLVDLNLGSYEYPYPAPEVEMY